MPLIVVTGYPSSGKSTIVKRLVKLFEDVGKIVHVVSDDDFPSHSRSCYVTSTAQEKDLLSWIRSEVQQQLSKKNIVICDALNYVKGYRYELFLAAKMSKTTYAVVQCTPDEATCLWLNSEKDVDVRYGDDAIKQLIFRYEKPDTKFRWEKPLFDIKIGKLERIRETEEDLEGDMMQDLDHPSPKFADLHSDELVQWICEGVELSENQSTQVVPLAPLNYLHTLDKVTQKVLTDLMNLQRTALRGQTLVIPGAEGKTIVFTKARTLPELNRLRQQFVSISKRTPIVDHEKIATIFVNFLANNLR
ncbi:unnamed protein product [Caenorhabditis auriculariae]|uniref:Protein KTI12 homolog n=1 Tax=Caenorhabditis auriculariae TaxID=2777116 RepID=A0A8S1HF34_9PELO|nr:unnamed protein product [Caenorhabditis auriculariae]